MGWIGSAVLLVAPKRSPGFWFFSMAMGADYSFELISIETYAPQYIWHNKFFLGSVIGVILKHSSTLHTYTLFIRIAETASFLYYQIWKSLPRVEYMFLFWKGVNTIRLFRENQSRGFCLFVCLNGHLQRSMSEHLKWFMFLALLSELLLGHLFLD